MNDSKNLRLPADLEQVGAHLRDNRHAASAVELDELKRRAMTQATRASRSRRKGSRVVTAFLFAGLSLTGASAGVVASSSGTSGGAPLAAISQYEEQLVLGEQIVPGSARLRGPSGCVGRPFRARVSGQNIARVVFRLDGRVIRRLTRPNLGSRFVVRVDPRRMRIGVHRLVATIQFTAATKKRPQTLRISFQRCARRLARPKFTG